MLPANLARKSRTSLASMAHRARLQLDRIKDDKEEIETKVLSSTTALGTFGLGHYVRRRLQLKGKRISFDKAGKIDAFAVTGAAMMIAGISPWLGDAGKIVAQAGAGLCSAGLVDTINRMAEEHHAAA